MTEPPRPTSSTAWALYARSIADELDWLGQRGHAVPDVLPSSSMESDNAETEPHQMAHLIGTLPHSASSNLHATAGWCVGGLLHNAPPFTLCRAAVEDGGPMLTGCFCADDEKKAAVASSGVRSPGTHSIRAGQPARRGSVNQPLNAAEFAKRERGPTR